MPNVTYISAFAIQVDRPVDVVCSGKLQGVLEDIRRTLSSKVRVASSGPNVSNWRA
jgi:hypothetical protein